MIYLGYEAEEKRRIVAEYCAGQGIRKVVVIAPERFPLAIPEADQVGYADVIMYVTFYRLLQEIDRETLVVLHECLRTQNRYDLAYNCIRNYLNRTPHVLVFQTLPLIDTAEDFMVLFDWATGSRWKRLGFDAELIRAEAQVSVREWPVAFERVDVPTSAATRRKYAEERERLFAGLGARDPHTLPRNLYLVGGRDKAAGLTHRGLTPQVLTPQVLTPQPPLLSCGSGEGESSGEGGRGVARNKRLGNGAIVTYDEVEPGPSTAAAASAQDARYTVLEFPHRFIDWCDFVAFTGQAVSRVLVADLPVDRWYFERYAAWGGRVHDTYASLRR